MMRNRLLFGLLILVLMFGGWGLVNAGILHPPFTPKTYPLQCNPSIFCQEPRLSNRGKEAFQHLLTTDTFAVGGVGFAGIPTKGGVALTLLLEEFDAQFYLEKLIEDDTLAGQLYGFVGLHWLDPEKFEELASPHINHQVTEPITTLVGCLDMQPFNNLLVEIQSGTIAKHYEYTLDYLFQHPTYRNLDQELFC